jgi:hypothetical protein
VEGFKELARVVVVAAVLITVCVNTEDVLAAKTVSPPYFAVIEWVPSESVESVILALFPLSAALPIALVPSNHVTMPVGVPGAELVTVAVKVTVWPGAEGFGELISVVVVGGLAV